MSVLSVMDTVAMVVVVTVGIVPVAAVEYLAFGMVVVVNVVTAV